ncbi:PREDICTED: protein BCCIP homolog [Tarenaya hassleriana]|uniref:protein BCCIP homolog n=1 Tax=Tarenaya hassleriana TaxID=28532 RepID=UPI00053C7C2F|nr:PREDICTED: protein BCCIP homolog [Tarenaya hassleriana]XP_019058380.1 PREDICTED: protein BCCIP homolog [Tarenaya hassleriana]
MTRKPTGRRRLLKHSPLPFSPFMRSLALASTARRKLPHPKASKSSESKLPDKELPNSSKNVKNERLSESSDEEDFEGVVQADFEFFDPKPEDFHGVKILLQNYLDDKEWDLSGFVDVILEQTTVGTVVKVADDEDEGLFAVVTALNLARYKDNKCMTELKDYLLKVCSEKNIMSELKLSLEDRSQNVGLLVSQRVVNLPPQLLPPLYDGLFDEISWATEDEPAEELRKSFCLKSYLILTKFYKLKNGDKRKRARGEEDEETIFLKPEDEIFLELSSWSFTFPLRTQLVTSQELRNYKLTGLLMAVEADKIPEFRRKLKSFVDDEP